MQLDKAIEHLRKDRTMAKVISEHGRLSLPPPRDNFPSLAGSIVSQQLSTSSAAAIWKRLQELLDLEVRPNALLRQDEGALRAVGLSRPKIKYLRALSQAFVDDPADYENLGDMTDEAVIEHLTRIKGIGVWTVHMFLIFNLLREDVFPVGDLGVRRAIERLYFGGEEQPRAVLTELSQRWKPYRSVASLYLWKSVD